MAKYTEKLVEKIILLIEKDSFSISEICNVLKISRKSFYEWKDTKPEFRAAIEKAMESRDEKLLVLARNSLKKKLEGYILTETRTTYIPDKDDPDKLVLKSKVVRQKEYAPDAQTIKLTLLKNSNKEENNKKENASSALTIIVQDPKTVEQLNHLREDLINGDRERDNLKQESYSRRSELSQTSSLESPSEVNSSPVIEKTKQSTPLRERDYSVPPGYLYRG